MKELHELNEKESKEFETVKINRSFDISEPTSSINTAVQRVKNVLQTKFNQLSSEHIQQISLKQQSITGQVERQLEAEERLSREKEERNQLTSEMKNQIIEREASLVSLKSSIDKLSNIEKKHDLSKIEDNLKLIGKLSLSANELVSEVSK